MAELKTKATKANVNQFLDTIPDETKRKDSYALLEIMKKATGAAPKMWGDSIVGFGDHHYISERTGREGDWFLVGFSPRKQNLTLYSMGGGWEQYEALREKLGKHTLGKSCLYLKKLDDVHLPTLKKMIDRAVKDSQKTIYHKKA